MSMVKVALLSYRCDFKKLLNLTQALLSISRARSSLSSSSSSLTFSMMLFIAVNYYVCCCHCSKTNGSTESEGVLLLVGLDGLT
jgi:hypothetical protein